MVVLRAVKYKPVSSSSACVNATVAQGLITAVPEQILELSESASTVLG